MLSPAITRLNVKFEGVDMLTLTYALVALSVEQKKVQGRLSELQQCVEKARSAATVIGHSEAESLLVEFLRLDDNCQSRNIELYVLPALRSLSPQADSRLAEVDEIAAKGRILLKKIRNNLRKIALQGEFVGARFFRFPGNVLPQFDEALDDRGNASSAIGAAAHFERRMV